MSYTMPFFGVITRGKCHAYTLQQIFLLGSTSQATMSEAISLSILENKVVFKNMYTEDGD